MAPPNAGNWSVLKTQTGSTMTLTFLQMQYPIHQTNASNVPAELPPVLSPSVSDPKERQLPAIACSNSEPRHSDHAAQGLNTLPIDQPSGDGPGKPTDSGLGAPEDQDNVPRRSKRAREMLVAPVTRDPASIPVSQKQKRMKLKERSKTGSRRPTPSVSDITPPVNSHKTFEPNCIGLLESIINAIWNQDIALGECETTFKTVAGVSTSDAKGENWVEQTLDILATNDMVQSTGNAYWVVCLYVFAEGLDSNIASIMQDEPGIAKKAATSRVLKRIAAHQAIQRERRRLPPLNQKESQTSARREK